MRQERQRADDMAAEAGLGRYVRFASPSYNDEMWFFVPVGGASAAGGVLGLLRHGSSWLAVSFFWSVLLVGVGLVLMTYLDTFSRRPGGPAPRLYCYEHGLVAGRRGVLRALRWEDVRLDSRAWEYWSAGDHYSGEARTLTAPDGTVLAAFHGDEPARAGAFQLAQLRKAALKRLEDTPEEPHPS
ncbi:hypothetical protein [Kitasatospora paranensis]|uniref:YcxB-like protein domain-containing protein n=1 Tax=Kitasatospora paranensis TaxID=258053 RepID=A0ABW2FUE0_9ACTN